MKSCLAALLMILSMGAGAAPVCTAAASDACYVSFKPGPGPLELHYYASMSPSAPATAAVIAMHGHPRDADRTFDATLRALRSSNALERTLVVAPLFQVDAAQATGCRTMSVPAAAPDDLLWTCASWLEGGVAANAGITSFAALDALVAELTQRWPGLRSITIAGFSAGAQMVQHYIGFAASDKVGTAVVRYVVADPGTWLYFDAYRPSPPSNACPGVDQWKYGTGSLPAALGRDAAAARARYAAADVSYLEGEFDTGSGPGTFYKILDKSCAANAQGPYRLQRGLAYAEYDRTTLAPGRQRSVKIASGCGHDVGCVFSSPAGTEALLGTVR